MLLGVKGDLNRVTGVTQPAGVAAGLQRSGCAAARDATRLCQQVACVAAAMEH